MFHNLNYAFCLTVTLVLVLDFLKNSIFYFYRKQRIDENFRKA
jgi:hypothetical protein